MESQQPNTLPDTTTKRDESPQPPGPETWRSQRTTWSTWLERMTLAVERPINRFVASQQVNPLYHTGAIAVFLLFVVGLTGLYLFFFFQYGFDASYEAVARMERQPIARAIRAIHRYASGALVITTLLHAYRTLFMERFRGPRWLAWVTGVVMTILLWGAGVTGYWIIWDQRAQVVTDLFADFLGSFSDFGPRLIAYITAVSGTPNSWPLLLILFAVHLLLFLIVAGFFWLHIYRLNRPKWFPPWQWVVGLGLVLLIVSALFPAGMLPQADFSRLPAQISFDPIFLFFLPASDTPAAPFLWGGLALAAAGLAALPWLSRGEKSVAEQPKVRVIDEACTGCTMCALDCPYKALEMVERDDDTGHKYIAVENTDLCVSCGICVGSCDWSAITLGETPPELVWESAAARLALAQAKAPPHGVKLIFTCERHAAHGARPYLEGTMHNGQAVEVIPLPCVGAALPGLMTQALEAGAAEVQVAGCPPDDCVNREGNLWTELRLTRRRVPRLRRQYARAPVTAVWLSPDNFAEAVTDTPLPPPEERLRRRLMRFPLTWRNLLPAFVLLAIVMVIQVLTTDLPWQPYPAQPALVQVVLADPALPLSRYEAATEGAVTVELLLDEEVVWAERYETAVLRRQSPVIFNEQELPPGEHTVILRFRQEATGSSYRLFQREVSIDQGEVLRVAYDPGRAIDCANEPCLKRMAAPAAKGKR